MSSSLPQLELVFGPEPVAPLRVLEAQATEVEAEESPVPHPVRKRPGAFAVFERDLGRSGRRWQTWAWRVFFGGAVLLLIGVAWEDRVSGLGQWDREDLSYAGHRIFQAFSFLLSWMLALTTPIVLAQGIIEEKDEHTLELLGISRLAPSSILWGKLLSRSVSLLMLVLTSMPLLAVCLSLGGFGPMDVLNLLVQLSVMVFSAGAVACFLGLYSEGPIVPTVLTWIWMALAYLPGAAPVAVAMRDDDPFAWISPVVALIEPQPFSALLVPLAFLPLCLGVMKLAGLTFRTLLAGADSADGGYGAISADVWPIERFKRRTALLFLFLGLSSPLLIFYKPLSTWLGPGPQSSLRLVPWLWNVAALCTFTVVFLLLSRAALLRLGARRRLRVPWRRMTKQWEGVGSEQRWYLREVWSNPVAWRETITRAHGSITDWIGRAYIAGTVTITAIALLSEQIWDQDVLMAASLFFLAAALALLILLTLSSMAGEKRARTLSLLCTTPMSGRQILGGKLAAVAFFVAPLFALAMLCSLGGMPVFGQWRWSMSVPPDTSALVLRWIGMGWWSLAALSWTAVSLQSIGLRAKSGARVWILGLLWVSFLAFGPPLLATLSRNGDLVDLLALFNPALGRHFWSDPRLPLATWLSAAGWSFATLLLFRINGDGLRRRVVR